MIVCFPVGKNKQPPSDIRTSKRYYGKIDLEKTKKAASLRTVCQMNCKMYFCNLVNLLKSFKSHYAVFVFVFRLAASQPASIAKPTAAAMFRIGSTGTRNRGWLAGPGSNAEATTISTISHISGLM